ncbi:MAG: hypothetical protein GX787_00285 [Tissierellia bacterium]|jgi:Na+-transporting methylmalonyl-CoA/oxaloacetate decarboxylase gamma subunit|nr:hypothetical protein [Tissierellia bacterium]
MGDYISLSQGITIALVSIIAVFAVLILIAFLISGLKGFSGENKEKVEEKPKEIKAIVEPIIVDDPDVITEELVAVIAAAIATNLGIKIPDINIKSIRRVPQMNTAWSNLGNLRKPIGRL